MKTVRRPPYPKWNPGYFPCSSLTPPSAFLKPSFGGFGLSGLVVFDVSQPAEPLLIGQYRVFDGEGSPENFTDIHNIFLSPNGDMLYAANTSFPLDSLSGRQTDLRPDLRIIDVSDPSSPEELARFAKVGKEGN